MNAQQRGPYLSSAKDTNVDSGAKVEPRNCLGQPLAAAKLKEREAASRQMKMKRNIEDIVLKAKARHGKGQRRPFPTYYLLHFLPLLFLQNWKTNRSSSQPSISSPKQ